MDPKALAPPRRVLVVANPVSGRGCGEREGHVLVQGFQRMGIEAELLLTRSRGDAPARMAGIEPADLVVAVGGDGTLSEVLQGLQDPTTPVGLLPCGTANVLAHALGLPLRTEEALETFRHPRVRMLDVARVGTRLSHLVVGVGFDAVAVQEVEARRQGPITKAVYPSAVWRALRKHRPVPLRIWLDEQEAPLGAGMVWISNAPKYADLLRLERDTRMDDGLWEVYLFPTASRRELLGAFLRGIVAGLPGGAVTMRRARKVRVEAQEPVPYQVDGDLGGTTPLEVALLPHRFRLVAP